MPPPGQRVDPRPLFGPFPRAGAWDSAWGNYRVDLSPMNSTAARRALPRFSGPHVVVVGVILTVNCLRGAQPFCRLSRAFGLAVPAVGPRLEQAPALHPTHRPPKTPWAQQKASSPTSCAGLAKWPAPGPNGERCDCLDQVSSRLQLPALSRTPEREHQRLPARASGLLRSVPVGRIKRAGFLLGHPTRPSSSWKLLGALSSATSSRASSPSRLLRPWPRLPGCCPRGRDEPGAGTGSCPSLRLSSPPRARSQPAFRPVALIGECPPILSGFLRATFPLQASFGAGMGLPNIYRRLRLSSYSRFSCASSTSSVIT